MVVFSVNPEEEILGYKCYKSVLDIKEAVDAAIITIPAKYVSGIVMNAGRRVLKASDHYIGIQ